MSDLGPRARLRARLLDRPLLADGGMGTLLFSRGVPQRACLDELAATRPELVGGAHREYLEAGAELIVTLSLGANRHRLEGFGLADRVAQLNRRAAQVAREARDVVGREALVGGSIGPLGVPTHELATLGEARGRALFREQIDGLLDGGIDLFVLETHPDLEALLWAVDEARRAVDLPILASLTFGEELTLPDGTSPAEAAAALAAAGVDAIGVNCGAGPVACLDALDALGDPGPDGPPRSIMPNAGLPQRLEGRFVYAAGADYFAAMTPAHAGVGRPDRRRLLRHDADPRRGHARRPRRPRGSTAAAPGRASTAARHPPPRRSPGRRRWSSPGAAWATRRRPPGWPRRSPPAGSSSRSRSTRRGRSGSTARSRRPGSCRRPASTSSTSATRRWRGCGWAPWPSPSGSSTTWTSSAWSTSRPATAT